MQLTATMPASTLGFHCSHEQHAPSTLLEHLKRAAAAGFTEAMCSDHFDPWSERQGSSGHAWTWLGAALATAPHTHPAVTAQAVATLTALWAGDTVTRSAFAAGA